MRIISLLPSNTEMVCALGLGEQLVGVSHECDYPPEVNRLPVLTASRVDSRATQADIHAQVLAVGQAGRGLYTVNEQTLQELEPDLILTQAKCEVCAVSYDDVVSAVDRLWPKKPPRVLSFQPNSIWDVFEDMRRIAQATAAPATPVLKELLDRVVDVQAKSAEGSGSVRPGVVFLEWLDPLMSCGCWQPEMIELVGGRCLISEVGQKAKWTTAEAIIAAQPDVVILGPCGMTLAQSRESVEALQAQAWFQNLSARAYVVDGNAYFNRPGPRLVDSLEMLADTIAGGDLSRWPSIMLSVVKHGKV